jgi:hypothetical protein
VCKLMNASKPRSSLVVQLIRAVVAGAIVLAAACSGSTSTSSTRHLAEGCTLNSDCEKGLVCALGRCRQQCVSSADCKGGGSCVTDASGGVCQTPDEKNTPCEQQRDCSLPLACAADYRCRNLCQSDVDCNVLGVSGRVCGTDSQGIRYCAEPPEVDAVTGLLITTPPGGAPDAAVVEPAPGASFSGGAIAFPIGPSGGTLGLGALTIDIPAGALDRTVNISITPITPPVAGSIGQAYEIGPTGTTFKQPARIVIAYALAELAGKTATDFAVSTVVDGQWQAVSSPTVDPYIDTIAGTTLHLSPYALAAFGGGADAGSAGDASVSGEAGASSAGDSSGGGSSISGGGSSIGAQGGTSHSGGAASTTQGGSSATAGAASGSAGSSGASATAGAGGAGGPGAVCSGVGQCGTGLACCNGHCFPSTLPCLGGAGGSAGASGGAGSSGSGGANGSAGSSGSAGAGGSGGTATATISAACQTCLGSGCPGPLKSCVSDPTCTTCADVNYLAPSCSSDPAFQTVRACGCSSCAASCTTECAAL